MAEARIGCSGWSYKDWRGPVYYAAKVGQFCTHRKKLKDPDIWLPRHLDRIRRLGDHLGPNLLQLPPSWKRDVGRLEAVLEILPDDIRWSVELRDPSWVHQDTFDALARHDVALCIHDLIADHPQVLTTDWTYIRYHGPDALNHPYVGLYGSDRVARDAERFATWLDDGIDVYAYFNNDWYGHAVTDGFDLRANLRDWAPQMSTA